MKIYEMIPDADDLLALSPEELAGYLLEYFLLGVKPNRNAIGLMHHVEKYPMEQRNNASAALLEAWMVLEAEGMLAPSAGDTAGWYVLTRRARSMKNREDFESFRHASKFPKTSIHPIVLKESYADFIRGDYESAIFKATKSIEVRVRDLGGEAFAQKIGVDLMRKAFKPVDGPLSAKEDPEAEQQATQSLFAGVIGRFKNPTSHRKVEFEPNEAVEVLQFLSYLHRELDWG